jgi:SAM-dependent methyltransferase
MQEAKLPLEVRSGSSRYADGSEDEVLRILRAADDRSTGSSELAEAIHDWPTEYHLSGDRALLLAPFLAGGCRRVLEVGAGTGILTRWLGEQGHEVVAVESSASRAEAAALRCEDLPGVHVIAGTLADLVDEGPFDVVLLIGVLEYAGTLALPSAAELLGDCRRLLAAQGALVVAIENQLGVQYLAGAPEDHHLRPGVGIEGYPAGGARTYHRRGLAALLADSGFPAQHWSSAFPDYKFPSAILSDHAFEVVPAGAVPGLVRSALARHHAETSTAFDPGLALATFVEAGLGPEVANSFVVVAAEDDGGVELLADRTELAWLFGGTRRPAWRTIRTLRRTDDGELVLAATGSPAARTQGWLTQHPPAVAPFVSGVDLLDRAVRASAGHDGAALDDVLAGWLTTIDAERVEAPVTRPGHPFVGAGARAGRLGWLSPHCLDLDLGNVIDGDDGRRHRIDTEWAVDGPVDRAIVTARALWGLARHLLARGLSFPGAPGCTVDDLTLLLAHRCGLALAPADLAAWRVAERQLQELVVGSPPALVAGYLDATFTAPAPRAP